MSVVVVMALFTGFLLTPGGGATAQAFGGGMPEAAGASVPSPLVKTQCTKNHTDNQTPKLKPCWEAPVEVHVVFIEKDGIHKYVTNAPNISVTFDNDGKNWSDDTLLKKKNWTVYTNEQGIVRTGSGYIRVPDPETNNTWMQNVTWNITVHFVWNLTLPERGSILIDKTEVKNITIPNTETENLTTNYSRWFVFTYTWCRLCHRTEQADDHWEAGVGIVAFILAGGIPAAIHFQKKREVEEAKRMEKEARFKI